MVLYTFATKVTLLTFVLDQAVPVLVTCHDCLAVRRARGEFSEVALPRQTARLAARLARAGLRRAPWLAAVSPSTRDDLLRLTGHSSARIAHIPNPLAKPLRQLPASEARRVLSEIGLCDTRRFFLHVGGSSWYKNRVGAYGSSQKWRNAQRSRI